MTQNICFKSNHYLKHFTYKEKFAFTKHLITLYNIFTILKKKLLTNI